jgi:hypothetical protein
VKKTEMCECVSVWVSTVFYGGPGGIERKPHTLVLEVMASITFDETI